MTNNLFIAGMCILILILVSGCDVVQSKCVVMEDYCYTEVFQKCNEPDYLKYHVDKDIEWVENDKCNVCYYDTVLDNGTGLWRKDKSCYAFNGTYRVDKDCYSVCTEWS